jgi:hypothetical protein
MEKEILIAAFPSAGVNAWAEEKAGAGVCTQKRNSRKTAGELLPPGKSGAYAGDTQGGKRALPVIAEKREKRPLFP